MSERFAKQNSLNTLREFGITNKGSQGGDNANLCNVSFGEAEVGKTESCFDAD